MIQPYQEITSGAHGEADSLRSEDLIDLWPRAEICQEGPESRLGEDIRLHGVMLKCKNTYLIIVKTNI